MRFFFLLSYARCQRTFSKYWRGRLLASLRRGSTLFCTIAGESQNLFRCKNRSMRSLLFSHYPGYSLLNPCDDITQNARGRGWEMSSKFRVKQIKTRWAFNKLQYAFSRYLYLLVEVFIKVSIQNVLVVNLGEDERFISVWLLHLTIRAHKWRREDIDQILPHGDSLFSVRSTEVMCQAKILLFG